MISVASLDLSVVYKVMGGPLWYGVQLQVYTVPQLTDISNQTITEYGETGIDFPKTRLVLNFISVLSLGSYWIVKGIKTFKNNRGFGAG